MDTVACWDGVSIQLMSPASGDKVETRYMKSFINGVSIQLMSPASGDFPVELIIKYKLK